MRSNAAPVAFWGFVMNRPLRTVVLLTAAMMFTGILAGRLAAQPPRYGHPPGPAYHHAPPPHGWQGHGYDRDNSGALVGGILLGLGIGALIGGALAPPPPVVYAPPPPGYYPAPPPVYYGY